MKKFRYVGLIILLVMVFCLALTACGKNTLTEIKLNTDNVKKQFTIDDEFTYDGLVVTAYYSVSGSEVVTDYDVTTPDMTSAGEKTVTVTYQDKTASYRITVSKPAVVEPERELQSISLNTDNVQKVFTAGDTFNHDNLVVTAHYNVAPLTEVITTGYSVSTPNMEVAKTHTVTVTYMGKTAQYQITVNEASIVEPERELQSISLNTDNVQKVFYVGETFSYEGLVVTANYNVAPLTEIVTEYTVNATEIDMSVAEQKTVVVTYMGKTAQYEITVKHPALTGITVDVSGATTVFTMGSEFSYAGIVVTAHYENDTTQVITSGYDVSTGELDMNEPGTYTITVTYETKEATYQVTVKAATLERIEVNADGATTLFYVDDEFTYEGIIVTAYYSDESSNPVTGYQVSTPDMSMAAEEVTITVTYQGKTATYSITVKEPALTGITVDESGAKLVFFVGDEFTYDGIVVTAHYENNTSEILDASAYQVSTPNMNEAATVTVTVSYQGMDATYEIEVKAVELERIEVNADEAKTEYIVGDQFTADGIVVTAYYNNGTSNTLGVEDYQVSEPDMNEATTVTITVTYQGKSATYTITVREPTLTGITVDKGSAKVEFYIGDEFTYEGIIVTAHYENNTSKILEAGEYQVSAPDMTQAAETATVTVAYQGEKATYTVTIVEPALTGISVDASGAKVKFYVDEVFTYNGLVVTAHYENGYSKIIEQGNYEISTPDMTTTGDKQVTVQYNGMEDKYTITVEYKIFAEAYNGQDLRLEAEESWLQGGLKSAGTYVGGINSGDKLTFMFNSTAEAKVELYLSMGHARDVADAFYIYVNDPDCESPYTIGITNTGGWTTMKEFFIGRASLVEGRNTIVIVANSKDINIDYLLISPDSSANPDMVLDYIEVDTTGAKTEYFVGDKFSYEGIVVTAHYENGTSATIEKGYEVSTPDMSTEGTKTVTVTYGEKDVTYQITVSYKVFAEEYNGESIIYEAEDSTLEGGLLAENDSSVSGGKRVSAIGKDDKLTFKFKSNVAETVELYLAMGRMETVPNAFFVYVNDPECATQYSVGIENTGGWTVMKEFFICRVDLVVGLNTIVIVSNSVGINLDYLRVAPDSSSDPGLVLERIEVDTSKATTAFNIGEAFSTEGLVVKAWYSNNTYDIVTDYETDTPDMLTTGIKTITVTYKDKSATYEITVKDPSVPDPEWAMTKISLGVEGESKVYLVFSGTYVSYNQADLQSTLYAALQWDIKQDTWATPSSAPDRIFVYGEGTWEIKMEITVGSLNNFFQVGRYFIDKTNPDNDKVGLYADKWTIGESVELGSYTYEFCSDTFYGTLTFRINKKASEEVPTYDGASELTLEAVDSVNHSGSLQGSFIGGLSSGNTISYTIQSSDEFTNVAVYMYLHAGNWNGWDLAGMLNNAFSIWVNDTEYGPFSWNGDNNKKDYLIGNINIPKGEVTITIKMGSDVANNFNFYYMKLVPTNGEVESELEGINTEAATVLYVEDIIAKKNEID
ncbi:MAG: bacterial Ig-like domain-containing protein [Clostridiales bacterium]|nr:bacterial Ig-like domain-containing protein [Clostridiales bacterium]